MLSNFIDTYYVRPIIEGTGYNPVNTVTYALILLAALFLILKVFRKMELDLDRTLWINLVPWVVLGGVMRALEDKAVFSFLGTMRYLFVTPLIYLTLFAVVFASLLILKKLKKSNNHLGYLGLIILAFSLLPVALKAERVIALAIILLISFGVFFSTWALLFKFKRKVFSEFMNCSPIFAHILDASSTFVAISVVGGYVEQHIVPRLIMENLHPAFFILFKVILVSLAIYFVDREVEGNWSWMLKFAILVVGLGPGVRNSLTILMGT